MTSYRFLLKIRGFWKYIWTHPENCVYQSKYSTLPMKNLNKYITRRSSCVNARGIPTTAYQVLHVLSCPCTPAWGTPHPDLAGGIPQVPLAGVHPPVLTWPGGTLSWGTPLPSYFHNRHYELHLSNNLHNSLDAFIYIFTQHYQSFQLK